VQPVSIFARKNYFYPDLPKGYQISQYEVPIVQGGSIAVYLEETEKRVQLTRAHLEEDAGKSLHEDFHGMSGIDLNRAGTPLLEIVSEPDMRSATEAVAYARTLHALVRWIDICDGNLQEGSFRCDANVSVRPLGDDRLGTRCEIKNLNSFRFLERAIVFEAKRQIALIEDGGRVVQETRLYDPDRDETRTMRSKEDAQDYRYFPDPDLLPLEVSEALVEQVRAALPELPGAKRERFQHDLGLSAYDAALLTATRETATYFEAALGAWPQQPKLTANWIIGELSSRLNKDSMGIEQSPIAPAALVGLLRRIDDGTISGKIAKEVFERMWETGAGADQIIDQDDRRQISDTGEIERIVDAIISANQAQVTEYRAGKEKAFNFLVGQVMKASKGKANPAQVNEMLKKKLAT